MGAFSELRKLIRFTKPWHGRLWHAVKLYFKRTHILAYGAHHRTEGGVPSGSGFTQLVDTLVTAYLMTDCVLFLAKKRIGSGPSTVDWDGITLLSEFCIVAKFLGDDSLLKLRFGLLTEDNKILSMYLKLRHNIDAHPEKGFFCARGVPSYNAIGSGDDFIPDEDHSTSETTEFLGKNLLGYGVLVIPTDLLLGQIYIPEKIDTSPDEVLTRIVGLAWSCGTSRKHYMILNSKWNEIKRRFPNSTPAPWSKNDKRYFRYVEGLETMPPNTFPDHATIHKRYVTDLAISRELRRVKENLDSVPWDVDLVIDPVVLEAARVQSAWT